MTEKKEEKKTVTVKKADGSMVEIPVEFRPKPDRLFVWDDGYRRGIGN